MPSSLFLVSRPQGSIVPSNLQKREEALPSPDSLPPGQLLIKNLFLSIDPTHRIWMSDMPQYMPCVPLDTVMRAATVGEVTASSDPAFPIGCKVVGFGGISEDYLGIPGTNVLYQVPENGLPLTTNLSVCSVVIGLCAWHGVRKILSPGKGDVVVVSAAAGAVGSLAAQLAKLVGAIVIGIAGGKEKCAWVKEDLKCDHAIDYKTGNVEEKLREALGGENAVTHFFDCVGGDVGDAVLACCKNFAKMAMCGSITEYNDQWTGLKNTNLMLMRRITVLKA